MKKGIVFLTSILIFFLSDFAHAQWQWQNPAPHGNDIYEIIFTDENNGWAIGKAGMSIYTGNGGENWNTTGIECYNDLNAICFADEIHGWIFGKDTIFRTTDGGAYWEPVEAVMNNSPFHELFKENVTDVSFVDSNKGWVITDDKIFSSHDAGNSWTEQYCLKSWQTCFHSVCFVNDTNGYATVWKRFNEFSHGIILIKTTDGGISWTESTVFMTATENSKSCVYFIDAIEGWIVGEMGKIRHTTNGGEDWTVQNSNISYRDLHSVYFIDENNGWTAGERCILRTVNGGESWSITYTYTMADIILKSIYFVDEMNGWAAGNNGELLYSVDGGSNWIHITTNVTNAALSSVHFTDQYNGWAAGSSGTILHTDNGGEDWENQESGINDDITSVFFIDSNRGWATCNNNIIAKTTDGGSSWDIQEFEEEYAINAIFFIDAQNGWIAGEFDDNGIILHTSDGGICWHNQWQGIQDTSDALLDITFVDSNHGWAAGGWELWGGWWPTIEGFILFTNDGGQTWIEQTVGETWSMVKSLSFIDAQSGWAILEEGGIIFHTDDGGQNWNSIESFESAIGSIFFTDELNGWIIGGGIYHISGIYSKIFVTSDGGTTWSPQYCPADFDMGSIYFPDPDNGWLVGENGAILYLDNSGPVEIDEFEVQSSEVKVEIYPNPCSSIANLRFTIHPSTSSGQANSRFTIIDLFDISGRKIRQLVNEVKMPGKYEIEVDVNDLPAGMYYLRIQAGNMIGKGKVLKMR